jgi:hypothetical protein
MGHFANFQSEPKVMCKTIRIQTERLRINIRIAIINHVQIRRLYVNIWSYMQICRSSDPALFCELAPPPVTFDTPRPLPSSNPRSSPSNSRHRAPPLPSRAGPAQGSRPYLLCRSSDGGLGALRPRWPDRLRRLGSAAPPACRIQFAESGPPRASASACCLPARTGSLQLCTHRFSELYLV